MRILAFFIFLCVLFSSSAAHAQQERGIGVVRKENAASTKGSLWALLIGNNDYIAKKWPTLKTAVKDVTALSQVLITRYNYPKQNVDLLLNATRREILAGFNALAAKSRPGDSVLIYYAGHGEFDANERGWWVPVDGRDNTDYISNDEILGRIGTIKARHKLLIADSCFSGNLLTRGVVTAPNAGRLSDRYVIEKSKLKSVQGLTSGGNEPVSDGGAKWEGHSIFAYHLLAQLKANQQPYLSVQLLGYNVSRFVANDTASVFGTGQTPVFSAIRNQGHQGGDFLFKTDPSTIRQLKNQVALIFAASPDEPAHAQTKAARNFVAQRLAENLRALQIDQAGPAGTMDIRDLQKSLPAAMRKAQSDAALVMTLEGSLKKEMTLMWQGHTTLSLRLRAYRLEGERLESIGSFKLTPQRLPMRQWSADSARIEEQFRKTAQKLFAKNSRAKLKKFLEQLEK